MEEFARYASVTTNEVEGIFLLDGGSPLRHARLKLVESYIESIPQESRHRKPVKIVKNTHQCFYLTNGIVSGERSFDNTFLKDLHCHLLQDNNIDLHCDQEDEQVAISIPVGEHRGVPSYASHEGAGSYLTSF